VIHSLGIHAKQKDGNIKKKINAGRDRDVKKEGDGERTDSVKKELLRVYAKELRMKDDLIDQSSLNGLTRSLSFPAS
jgi:hypothetical protein